MADEKEKKGTEPEGGNEGGAGGNENGGAGNENNGGGNEGGAGEKTFTQSEVNRMMAREKSQGRSAALRELGIDPKDSKAMESVKAYIESQKTDGQKAVEEDQRVREAEEKAAIAEAKVEALALGCNPKYVDDVVTLASNRVKAENGEIKTIMGEMKTKYPEWFEKVSSDDDKEKGKAGTGTSIKGGKAGSEGGKNDDNLGKRLAAQRRGAGNKKSLWG